MCFCCSEKVIKMEAGGAKKPEGGGGRKEEGGEGRKGQGVRGTVSFPSSPCCVALCN